MTTHTTPSQNHHCRQAPQALIDQKHAPEHIQNILKHPKVWRASLLAENNARRKRTSKALPSGFATLDHHLSGGWPLGQLTELSYGATGIGELTLILPALAQLSMQNSQSIAWIHPQLTTTPYPNPHHLSAHGININKILWITPKTLTDALWAAEQCLNSAGCSATVLWLPPNTRSPALYRTLQKLQIAAQRTQNWGIVLRGGVHDIRKLGHAPAPLRLYVSPTKSALEIQIVKRPQGWALPPFALTLPNQKARTQRYWHWQHLDWGTAITAPPRRTVHEKKQYVSSEYASPHSPYKGGYVS